MKQYGVRVQRAGVFVVVLIFQRDGDEVSPVTSLYGKNLQEVMFKVEGRFGSRVTHVILEDGTWEAPDELSVGEALEAHYGLVLFSKEEED